MSRLDVRKAQIRLWAQIFGAFTWLVVGRLLGIEGIAYMAAAFQGYVVLCSLLTDQIPNVLGKMIRGRNEKEQYKNASVVGGTAIIIQIVFALLGGVAMFFAAPLLSEFVFKMPMATIAIQMLAVVFVVRLLSDLFLGLCMGKGNQFLLSFIFPLRQILYLAADMILIPHFMDYGRNVELLLLNDAVPAAYGCVGMAAGMLLTEIILFVILLIMSAVIKSGREKGKQGLKKTETYTQAALSLYGMTLPGALTAFMTFSVVWLGLIIHAHAAETSEFVYEYGIWYGSYVMICMIGICFCAVLLYTLCGKTVRAVSREDMRMIRNYLGTTVHCALSYGIFAAIFTAVMSSQITSVFASFSPEFNDAGVRQSVSAMFAGGSVILLFGVLSFVFIRILMGMKKTGRVICAVAGYIAVFVIADFLCLNIWDQGIYSLIYAGIVSAAFLCAVSGIMLFLMLKVRFDLLRWVGIPLVSGGICGLAALAFDRFVTDRLGDLPTLILALVVCVILYWFLQLLAGSFRKSEFALIPGGKLLRSIASFLP